MIEKSKKYDLIILGFKTKNNKDCGLIKVNKDRLVKEIIEYKNSNKIEKKINICNSGVMLMSYKSIKMINKIKKIKFQKNIT